MLTARHSLASRQAAKPQRRAFTSHRTRGEEPFTSSRTHGNSRTRHRPRTATPAVHVIAHARQRQRYASSRTHGNASRTPHRVRTATAVHVIAHARQPSGTRHRVRTATP